MTDTLKIDNLRKFAKTSNVAEVLLDRLKSSHKESNERCKVSDQYRRQQRIKFEDTNLAYADFVLDPKLPAKVDAVRIFDNIVERASREMIRNLV